MQIDSSHATPAHAGHAHPRQHADDRSAAPGRVSVRSTALQVARTQQASLEIVTAEGDRVSLSAARSQDLALDRYEAHIRTAAGHAAQHAQRLSVSEASSLVLEVDGDLNEAELADIMKLVQDMDRMGQSLFAGGLEGVPQLGGTLVAARGELSITQQITATVARAAGPLEHGRAQRRAARQAGEIVRRRPERAERLQRVLPKIADRVFDRLGARFGREAAEAARTTFRSVLSDELARAAAEPGGRLGRLRAGLNPYLGTTPDGTPSTPEHEAPAAVAGPAEPGGNSPPANKEHTTVAASPYEGHEFVEPSVGEARHDESHQVVEASEDDHQEAAEASHEGYEPVQDGPIVARAPGPYVPPGLVNRTDGSPIA